MAASTAFVKREIGSHTHNISLVGAINGAGDVNQPINTSLNLSQNIAILTGVLNHGETIPVPNGFTVEQCKWFVSPTEIPVHTTFTNGKIYCGTNGLNVIARIEYTNPNLSWQTLYFNFKANYMIIGIK